MADVNIQLGYKNTAWFTANAAIVLDAGQIVYLEQTGTYKLGDGVTALSALSFLGGGGGGTQNLDQVLTEGNTTGGNNIVVTNGDVIKASDDSSNIYIGNNGQIDITTDNGNFGESYLTLTPTIAYLSSNAVNYINMTIGSTTLNHDTLLNINAPSVLVNGNTLSGTNTGDNATNSTSNSYADGKVADAINDGTTTIAPSQNAVFDALALKSAGTIIVTSGTSFTTPSNITTSTIFFIELVGGGGGGGGRSAANLSGSGAGGGGYCFVKVTGLTPSTSYTCAVGAGGAGGADATNGNDGGNTTLTIGATTYTASGGIKGLTAASSEGGLGGSGTNGDLNLTGQKGASNPSTGSAAVIASEGGDAPKGWGSGGTSRFTGVGNNGLNYGGGGASSKAGAAGNGTNGIIYCQYVN